MTQSMEPHSTPSPAEATAPAAGSATTHGNEPAPSPSTGAPAGRAGVGLLGAALLLGLLRFVRLGEWSLWYDEVLTWGDSHHSPGGLINAAGYWLVRQTVELLGGQPTEANLRLLPAIAGYLAIPATFWAFRPLAGGRRAGLAAVLVAASVWEMQWSQTARFYTFVQLVALLGGGVLIRGLLTGRALQVALGVVVVGGGVLFHLQAGAVAVALLVAATLAPPSAEPGARRAAVRGLALLAVPALLALPKVLGAWSGYAEKKAAADTVGSIAHFLLSTGWYVTPALGAAAAAAGLLVLVRGDARGRFALVVATVGAAEMALASAFATVSAQYLFALFPWIALVAAWPFGSAGVAAVRGARPALALALVLPQLAATALYLSAEQGQRPRWRDAVEFVEARRQPGDVVASDPASVVEFYLGDRDPRRVREPEEVLHFDRFNPWFIRQPVLEGKSVWLVVRNDTLMTYGRELRAEVRRYIAENYQLVERFPVLVQGRDLSIDVWHHP